MTFLERPPEGMIDQLMVCPACRGKGTCLKISYRHPTTLECAVCSSRFLLTENRRGDPEWLLDR